MKFFKIPFSFAVYLLPLLAVGLAFTQQSLTLNNPLTRSLNKGETHEYRLTLAAGDYARVEAKAGSGDVLLTLATADGQKIMTVKAKNGVPDGATLATVAETAADYLINIIAADSNRSDVAYHVTLLELRAATEIDRARCMAEKLFAEGEELLGKRAMPSALEKYQASLPFWRAANDVRGEADAYSTMGQAYYLLGNYREALAAYETALPLARLAKSLKLEAGTLNNTGLIYNDQYDQQRALTFYLQALSIYRGLGNSRNEARCLSNIGSIYTLNGQPQEALKWYEQALTLSRALADKALETGVLTGRGSARYFLQNYAEALKDHESAFQIARLSNNEYQQGVALANQASVYIELQQAQAALTRLNEALPLLRKTRGQSYEAFTLHRLGDAYLLLGQPEKALEYYQQAQGLRQELGEKIMEALTTSKIAQAEWQRGQPAIALTHSQRALEIVESVRTRYSSPYLSASYSSSTYHYYDEHIGLLLQLHRQQPAAGYDVQAFQTSERARARSLLEILAELGTDIRTEAAPELLAREADLQRALDSNSRERARLAHQPAIAETREKLTAREKELLQLTTEYAQVQGQIRSSNPRYDALARPQPLSLAEVQQQALKADSLLLEYLIGRDRIYLFAVGADSNSPLKVFELTAKAEIERAAAFFKRRKEESGEQLLARLSAQNLEFRQTVQTLSEKLLLPVKALLGTKKLLVVSDGALQYVPFAALPEPAVSGQRLAVRNNTKTQPSAQRTPPSYTPLIVKHEVVNVPSASTLALLRRALGQRPPAPELIAVLADPVFNVEDERVKGSSPQPARPDSTIASRDTLSPDIAKALRDAGVLGEPVNLERLPASGAEARAIADLAPGQKSLVALGFDANRERVTGGALNRFRYIHFATHAFVDDRHPQLSWLALSQFDRRGREQNGFLRLSDIYKLRLSADLVVLGACRTGLGQELRGEGMIGLTRGFMYAGAPRVIVSLWDVSDSATARLMKSFYGYLLQQRLTPSAALRQAQLDMWRQNRAPFYWAAFTLQGDPE